MVSSQTQPSALGPRPGQEPRRRGDVASGGQEGCRGWAGGLSRLTEGVVAIQTRGLSFFFPCFLLRRGWGGPRSRPGCG